MKLLLLVCPLYVACNTHIDPKLRRHFNRVLVEHLKGVGFAQAQKSIDSGNGLALWWQELAIEGGWDSLVNDDEVRVLAYQLYEHAISSVSFKNAKSEVNRLRQDSADEDTINQAKFHMQAMFVQQLIDQAHERGCMIKRPDYAPTLEVLKPGVSGSFIATDAKNFGTTKYIADLLETNANLDVKEHKTLLGAFTVAQIIFKSKMADSFAS
jgi:hypothetical protein